MAVRATRASAHAITENTAAPARATSLKLHVVNNDIPTPARVTRLSIHVVSDVPSGPPILPPIPGPFISPPVFLAGWGKVKPRLYGRAIGQTIRPPQTTAPPASDTQTTTTAPSAPTTTEPTAPPPASEPAPTIPPSGSGKPSKEPRPPRTSPPGGGKRR